MYESEKNAIGFGQAPMDLRKALGVRSDTPTPAVPEIAKEHQLLRASVEALSAIVEELQDRLRHVVIHRPQEVGIEPKATEPCRSELGQGINEATAGIRSACARMKVLLQSLAV